MSDDRDPFSHDPFGDALIIIALAALPVAIIVYAVWAVSR